MSDIAHPTAKKIEDIIEAVAWEALVKGTLASMGIDVWPVNSIVRIFTDRLWEGFRLLVDRPLIVILNTKALKEFEPIAVRLKIIAGAEGIDSQAFAKVREEARNAFSKVVRFNAAL